MCVQRRREDDQTTMRVPVDALMITSKNKCDIDTAVKEMETGFGSVSVNRGKLQNYIGTVFDFTSVMEVTANMIKYVEQLLTYTVDKSYAPTPAEDNLFNIMYHDAVLDEKNRSKFHTIVAKFLYLSKQARTDILLAVPYLTTRVTCATAGDMKKLLRCFEYLHKTKNLVLSMKGDDYINLMMYIDTSYGTH